MMAKKKVSDAEYAARQVLAKKLKMELSTWVETIGRLGHEKKPDITKLRNYSLEIRDILDAKFAEYDARYGEDAGWLSTGGKQRQIITRLTRYTNGNIEAIKAQSNMIARQHVQLAGAVPAVEACQGLVRELVKLCQDNGVTIPDELMGGPLQ